MSIEETDPRGNVRRMFGDVDQIARRTSVQVGVRDHIPNVKTLAHRVTVDGGDAARLALLGERFGDVSAAVFHGHRDLVLELQLLAAQTEAWLEVLLDDDAA
jgi:hypothetical protein